MEKEEPNYREDFLRESGIDVTDFETAGKFPYYNPLKKRNGSIARGQGWRLYAEWLEKKLKEAKK